jgi:hypothetical protein
MLTSTQVHAHDFSTTSLNIETSMFALPIVYETIINTISGNGVNAQTATLNKVSFATD